MQSDLTPTPPPGPPYPPPRPRRLTRSSRERMVAGVGGGMAEYFDLDPALVRLLWVAAAIVSGGLAVPLYFLAWIILPRDDRPPATSGSQQWRDWSREFHSETQRLAEEARRVADDIREPRPTEPGAPRDPATDKGAPAATPPASEPWGPPSGDATPPPPTAPTTDPWATPAYQQTSYQPSAQDPWAGQQDLEHHRHRHGPPRSAGVVLVGLGVLLLLANAGIFSFINWSTMWPLILIGLGAVLLAKQTNWGG